MFDIIQTLYLDDEAFVFESREDMIKGLALIKKTFEVFGLQMHIGSGTTPSKTECVFFPKPGFFSMPKLLQGNNTPNNSIVPTKMKKTP